MATLSDATPQLYGESGNSRSEAHGSKVSGKTRTSSLGRGNAKEQVW